MTENQPKAAKSSGLTIQDASLSWTGLFHLSVIYLVWSSTYLAIRVGVREGAGFPPFMMGAMRVLAASSLLFLGTAFTRQRIRLSWREGALLATSGVLLWLGGLGLVTWAEQRAHSLFAALLIGSEPMWVALIEAFLDRRKPSLFFALSLLAGFAGIGLLSAPVLISGVKADVLSVAALVLAAVSWGSGSILQQRNPVNVSPNVSSAYQLLFGGLGLLSAAFLFQEPRPTPTPEAWLAWGYLVVLGSLVAFTSYVQALRLLPIRIVMTYAYVNPVIAMFLGWSILHEPITLWTAAGAFLVLIGVAGIFKTKHYAE